MEFKARQKENFGDVRWSSVCQKSHRVCSIEGQNGREFQVLNKQINLVLCSLLMIGMKTLESKHHNAKLKVMLRKELRIWTFGLHLKENKIMHTRKCPRRLLRINTYSHPHSIKGDSRLRKFIALIEMIN